MTDGEGLNWAQVEHLIDRCEGCRTPLVRCYEAIARDEGAIKCCPDCAHPVEMAAWDVIRTRYGIFGGERGNPMTDTAIRYPCTRCGQPVSERGRLCLDCVYVLPLTERQTVWSRR